MKSSLTIALQKVIKTFDSCTTTTHYVAANRLRTAFHRLYLNSPINMILYSDINQLLDNAQDDCLNKFETLTTKTQGK